MTLHNAPHSICLLRLSALGDVTHVLPLIHTLRRAWPLVQLTWIIGKAEALLLEGLEGVELIVFDKRAGIAGIKNLRATLAVRHFDVLLNLQLALRAGLLSTLVKARVRIGYDRLRSKELHGLFITHRIPAGGHHVLDVIGRFALPLGLQPAPVEWNLPIPISATEWSHRQWPEDDQPTLLISPCSSHPARNWRAERYAAIAEHAFRRGWRIVLCGGRSELERATGDAITSCTHAAIIDLIGKDTLKQLMALLQRADLVLTPDSGPTHIANALGTPVLGLHACTDAERSGPYSDRRWCVNRFADAARVFLGKDSRALPWGSKIERPGVMDLITVDDVIERFEAFSAHPSSVLKI